MDLRHLDIFPLRCLCALVNQQHVTRAADLMGISQPRMSATLKRLREQFMDPILVRTEKGMVATPRAREIVASVEDAIDSIDRVLRARVQFDPFSDPYTFHISASESVALAIMPEISSVLRRESSRVVLRVHTPNLSTVRQDLEDGRIDLAIGHFRNPPEGLRHIPLIKQRLLVIASKNNPDIGRPLTLDQYLGASHARYALTPSGTSVIEDDIDEALLGIGAVRSIGMQLPSAVALPPVVAATDLVATVPESVAVLYSRALDLQVLEPPFDVSDISIKMYWHERTHRQPAVQWLRSLISQSFMERKRPPARSKRAGGGRPKAI